LIYTESNLARAFADVGNVPAELRRAMLDEWPLVVPPYVDILVAGDGGPTPLVSPLLVWGARDRLPGTSLRGAARWRDRLPGASLRVIEGAGHFPQVEAPEAFVEAFESFVRAAEQRRASASSATQARPTGE
jgi:pimeloyl-ACP methyl ester carboxylesterase